MMMRIFFLASALSLSTIAACGMSEDDQRNALIQEYSDMMDQTVALAQSTNGMGAPPVWVLADDDTRIHIFGTYHLLPPDADWRSDAFDSALSTAHTLYTETDTDSPEAEEKITRYMLDMMAEQREPLSELLSQSEYEIVAQAAADVGIPMVSIDLMSPEWAAMTISMQDSANQGYDPELGVETIAEAEAKASGKKLGFLETIEFQLELLSGLPMDEQIEMLVYSAAMIEQGREYGDVMLSEWLDGDIAGIGVMIDPEIFGSDEIYNALLTDRNAAWVPQIEAMLDEPGDVLVAVGAAHLAGPDSVILMLREKGYEVEGP